MFKTGLLVSTAMTAVALLLAGAPAPAQTDMHVASRDPNTRFLCTYGQFLVSSGSFDANGFFAYTWTHVAVPVIGHGERVRRIRVIEERKTRWWSPEKYFTVGIYSNAASGFPGKLIAGGTHSSMASPSCAPVQISIAPTTLKRQQRYWIEETVNSPSTSTSFYWEVEPKAKRKAYVQTFRRAFSSACGCSSSYLSPWTKQTTAPYFELK